MIGYLIFYLNGDVFLEIKRITIKFGLKYMFKQILIANRGEIALRIGRTCKKLDINPIFIYELADKDLPHASTKNSFLIDSYTNAEEIVNIAKKLDIDAIHPGYGFLSEDANLVKLIQEANIEFIGPSYSAMSKLGNKQTMLRSTRIANLPHIPGFLHDIIDVDEILQSAEQLGYPVITKGIDSAGGRQIKKLVDKKDVVNSIVQFEKEQISSEVYMSKFLTNVKHIEVQILGDKQGKV